jgi:hypothetical protein
MDDAVSSRSRLSEPVEIGEITGSGLGAQGFQGGGCRLGARKADDLVAGGEEFGDDG